MLVKCGSLPNSLSNKCADYFCLLGIFSMALIILNFLHYLSTCLVNYLSSVRNILEVRT